MNIISYVVVGLDGPKAGKFLQIAVFLMVYGSSI